MNKEEKNALDYELLGEFNRQSIESQLEENEKLIWAAKPKYTFSLTPLEVGGYDVALGPTNLYFIALGISWYCSYEAFISTNHIKAILLFLLGLIIFLLPDVVKEIRRRNTYYAVTNKHIFFQLWGIRKSKRRIEKVEFDSIHDIRYEEYKDKSGVLYFIFKNPSSFKTYDFSAGGSRHHPTFENVVEVISLHKRIEEIRKTIANNKRI